MSKCGYRLLLLMAVFVSLSLMSTAAQEPIHITLAHWSQDPAFLATIESFHESQDRIRVSIRSYSWGEYGEKLAVETAAGTGPDVINMHGSQTPVGIWVPNLIVDLTPYIERDRDELDMDDFLPGAMNMVTKGDIIFALPYMMPIASNVAIYRIDSLVQAGFDKPSSEWTWSDLEEIARRTQRDTDGDGAIDFHGITANTSWRLMHHLILSAGDWYYANDDRELDLSGEGSQEAMTWVKDLAERGIMAPPSLGNVFNRGNATFHLGQSWGHVVRGIAENWYGGSSVGAAIMPKHPGTGGRVFEAGVMQLGFGISVASKHPDAAWEFVKFAAGKQGWAKAGYEQTGGLFFLPARRSLVMEYFTRPVAGADPAHVNPEMELDASSYVRTAYLDSANHNLLTNWALIESAMERVWRSVLEGRQSIPAFIETVRPEVNALLQANR